jgi:hypothetical protein
MTLRDRPFGHGHVTVTQDLITVMVTIVTMTVSDRESDDFVDPYRLHVHPIATLIFSLISRQDSPTPSPSCIKIS